MDPTTATITTIASICIMVLGIVALVGSMYGILVWYPAQRKKESGCSQSDCQGEATILRLPDPIPHRSARAVFTRIPIGLEIRVPGMEAYEVDKVFTIPSSAVREIQVSKVVPAWVNPRQPRDPDKIVIHIDQQ